MTERRARCSPFYPSLLPPPMASTSTPEPLSLLFLSVVVILVNGGLAGHLEYQTLVLAPLSKPSQLGSYVNGGSSDLAWSVGAEATTEEATSAEGASASLELPLYHRDSLSLLAVNCTPEALFYLRLQRDAARVSRIGMLAEAASVSSALGEEQAKPRPAARGGFSSSVVSGLAQGSGEYFTRIGIGIPPTHVSMVLDTGSDVVWVQCAPCRKCYSQSDPVFDPRLSRSYAPVRCGAPLCRSLDVSGCDARSLSCLYQVSYGDGSATTGEFSTETLSFRRSVRVQQVAFGCGHDNEGLFVAAAGLLGLGRGSLSFPSQAGRRYGRKFSYCLVDRTSGDLPKKHTSVVIFGEKAMPRDGVVYTPMVVNPLLDTFYYVELTGISVGGIRVPGVRASDLRLDLPTGKGGVIVDSGTSVTRLIRPAYAALREAFRSGTTGLRPAAGFSLFDTCYDLSGKTEVKVPTVVLHFRGCGRSAVANVSLPAENYLIPVDTDGVFCFAFAPTDGGISIVGNIQQQGFRVAFDGDGGRVGFAPGRC